MSKYQTPYRYDFVGSFLRPQEVKQAKADYSEGKITKEECDAADVFNSNIRFTMIRLGTNIESFGMFAIHFVFNFTKRFTNLIS